jgi:uncharacterized Rossmann fold enzyme
MLKALRVDEIQDGEKILLARVNHEQVMNVTSDVVFSQTAHNLARGLPELSKVVVPRRFARRRVASVCGSGPSLMDNIDSLRGDVMAANAAIGAVVGAGVMPRYAMIWDATPEMVRYADLLPGCTWLIASRVHPEVIDRLLEFKQDILLWHAATTDPDLTALYGPRLQVFGGSTAVTRGVFLLGALGYREFHIFGADSSFTSETHVGGSLRDERKGEVVAVCEGRMFRTTGWMLLQAESWCQFVMPQLTDEGARVEVYGDGLLPWAHRKWVEKNRKPRLWERIRGRV